MFDTTRMLTNMVLSGNKKRFSDIKMISAHAGGTAPFLVSRIQILEAHFGPGRDRAPLSAGEIWESLASFYYDLTCSTSIAQLGALLELVPVSQLLMGFDIPFMPFLLDRTCDCGYPTFFSLRRERSAHAFLRQCQPRLSWARIAHSEQPDRNIGWVMGSNRGLLHQPDLAHLTTQ